MAKQQLKLLATPDKTRTEKTLVELSEEQLEAIAAGGTDIGGCHPPGCTVNHNETMFVFAQLNLEGDTECRAQKREKFTATPDKTRLKKPLVELTEEQLEAIAGGEGCPIYHCGTNHNETMFVFAQLNLEGVTDG